MRAADVIAAVAAAYGLVEGDLVGRSMAPDVVRARDVAALLARELTGQSWAQLGPTFERDHTSLISAARRAEASARMDPEFAAEIEALRVHVGGGPIAVAIWRRTVRLALAALDHEHRARRIAVLAAPFAELERLGRRAGGGDAG